MFIYLRLLFGCLSRFVFVGFTKCFFYFGRLLKTMSLWKNNHLLPLPYSVQYNSDPRCRHHTYRRAQSNSFVTNDHCNKHQIRGTQTLSHPYIVAQRERIKKSNSHKQCKDDNSGRNQGIKCSKSMPNSNRKRKFIDTFGSDEEGQYEYNQSLLVIPPSKKKVVTERDVMKTVRDLNKAKRPKAWRQLIQTYCSNNRHCDVQHFTKMDTIHYKINEQKKKRAIRLHPSYAGFTNKFHCLDAERAKQYANRTYVNKNVSKFHSNKETKNNNLMDCD